MLGFDADMIYRIPALLIALTVHEYAHAVVADSMGDPTPRYTGRLTMNPLAHLDIVGTMLMLFAGFGWAKPVEINPSYFRDGKKGVRAVSFAGPASNLFLAFLAIVFTGLLNNFNIISGGVYKFLFWVQMYNVWFAFFNLIPLPPLDGSKILISYLPGRYAYKLMEIGAYSNIILIVLVFTGIAGMVIRPFASFYLTSIHIFVNSILGFIFRLF